MFLKVNISVIILNYDLREEDISTEKLDYD